MKILIVDDDPANLKLLRAVLEADGATVLQACDGLDAINLLREVGVDAVISDILMPRMDGYRLCMEMRAHSSTCDLPFIAYTATYTGPENEALMMEVGANRFLRKPASAALLTCTVGQLVLRRRPPVFADRPRPQTELLKGCNAQLLKKLQEKRLELLAKDARLAELEGIAEQALAGQKLLLLRLKQTQRLALLGSIAGGVAHDFNNSLGAIYNHCELARGEAGNSAELSRHLDGLMTSAQYASALARKILSSLREEPAELKPMELRQTVIAAANLLRVAAPFGTEIQTALGVLPLFVHADATQMQRVLINLGVNALQAMAKPGGRLIVSLTTAAVDTETNLEHATILPGRYALLTLQDNGHGMDRETLGRIFDPYFTTNHAGGGCGMGLAVVREIVQTHRGGISVASQPGVGTSFQVYLPLCADAH